VSDLTTTGGALRGITVVDLSVFLPGPMLTMMMADQGATVIKVEPPTGDPAREMGPFFANGDSVWFRQVNRGKTCRRLDLKTTDGIEQLWELIDTADVLVESFRPGVMSRLGFGYDAVSERRPGIVYCSLSAFGQTGSAAHHPAHDLGAQALSGLLAVNDDASGRPVVPGVAAGDMALCLTGLSAVLMAVIQRQSTGRGAYIDSCMYDALLPWGAHTVSAALLGGPAPRSSEQRSLGGSAFYNIYDTADGRQVVLCGREVKFARTLLEALGRADLAPLAELEPGEPQAPLRRFLDEVFRTRTRDEWTEWFENRDVAFAPVLDFAETLQSELAAERGRVIEHPDATREIAPAIRLASGPPQQLPEARE
jgi:crotonobetainyl-CoA:carnitine CoA-transferase CaiB-like acyl-CoA transferase